MQTNFCKCGRVSTVKINNEWYCEKHRPKDDKPSCTEKEEQLDLFEQMDKEHADRVALFDDSAE